MLSHHSNAHAGGNSSENQLVTITVNKVKVSVLGSKVAGINIKKAAIEQGVEIELDFTLHHVGSDGERELVEDGREIQLLEGMQFVAVIAREHLFAAFINDHAIKLIGATAKGREIKAAGIEQGIDIKLSYILAMRCADGGTIVVGDDDDVPLKDNIRFIAHEHGQHVVNIKVNEQPVKLHVFSATGQEIKDAAIAQGVHIQQNFVLQEELPNGTSRIVGDGDIVHLHQHLKFTAIAPDDNS